MKQKFIGLIAFGALLGCTTAAPLKIESDPVRAGFLASAPTDRIVEKTSTTTIRAYKLVVDDEGKETRAEIAGAKCKLTSDHIRAEVITPQEVVLPKYDQDPKLQDRGLPPSILVACVGGDLKGKGLLTAKPGSISSGGSGNLLVDLVVIAGTAAIAASQNWAFEPTVSVTME